MAPKYQKYINADVVSLLEEKMLSNTEYYQSDFEIDKKIFAECVQSKRKEDKTLFWLSRPMGTQCNKAHDVFIRGSAAHNTWRFHAEQTSGPFIACAVELKGIDPSGVIRGDVFELDYLAFAKEILQKSVEPLAVEKTFQDGYVDQVEFTSSHYFHYAPLVERHGPIVDSFIIPKDADALNYVLQEQKNIRDKLQAAPVIPDLADLPLEASHLTGEHVQGDPYLFTCVADKEYAFFIRAIDLADAEQYGAAWYERNVFEPGRFDCRKAWPEDLKGIVQDQIVESRKYLSMLNKQVKKKAALDDQIHAAEAKKEPSATKESPAKTAER